MIINISTKTPFVYKGVTYQSIWQYAQWQRASHAPKSQEAILVTVKPALMKKIADLSLKNKPTHVTTDKKRFAKMRAAIKLFYMENPIILRNIMAGYKTDPKILCNALDKYLGVTNALGTIIEKLVKDAIGLDRETNIATRITCPKTPNNSVSDPDQDSEPTDVQVVTFDDVIDDTPEITGIEFSGLENMINAQIDLHKATDKPEKPKVPEHVTQTIMPSDDIDIDIDDARMAIGESIKYVPDDNANNFIKYTYGEDSDWLNGLSESEDMIIIKTINDCKSEYVYVPLDKNSTSISKLLIIAITKLQKKGRNILVMVNKESLTLLNKSGFSSMNVVEFNRLQ